MKKTKGSKPSQFKILSKLLLQSNGIALIQAMTGLMVVGAVTGLIVKNSDLLTKNLASAYFSEEIKIKEDFVKNLLINQEFCTYTFRGLSLGGPSVGQIGGGDYPLAIKEGELFGFNNSFKVTGIKLNSVGIANLAEVELIAELKTNIAGKRTIFSFGASEVSKRFRIFAEMSGGVVDNCFYDPGVTDEDNYNGYVSDALENICNSQDSYSLDPSDSTNLTNPSAAGSYFDPITKTCKTRGFPLTSGSEETASNDCPTGRVASELKLKVGSNNILEFGCVKNAYDLRGFSCSDVGDPRYFYDDDVPDHVSQNSSNYYVLGFTANGKVHCGKVRYENLEFMMDLDNDLEAVACDDDARLLFLSDKIRVGCSASTPTTLACPSINCDWTCGDWEEQGECVDAEITEVRSCEITTQPSCGGVTCAENQPETNRVNPCDDEDEYECDPGAIAATTYDEFGDGTIGAPYEIGNQTVLNHLATSGAADWDKSFVICNDITTNAVSSTIPPIGNSSIPFSGNFNGNGKSLIEFDASHALFGYMGGGAIVRQLNFFNSNVNCTTDHCAILVGQIFGNSPEIIGINIDADSSVVSNSSYVGSVVGSSNAQSLALTNIKSKATLDLTASSFVGGVAGALSGGLVANNVEADMSSALVTVNGSESIEQIGGVFGSVTLNRASSISNIQNTADAIKIVSLGAGNVSMLGGVIGNLYISLGAGAVGVSNVDVNSVFKIQTGLGTMFYLGGAFGRVSGGDVSNYASISGVETVGQEGNGSGNDFDVVYQGGVVGSITDHNLIGSSTSNWISGQPGIVNQSSYTGGFVGHMGGNARIENSFSNGNLSSQKYSAGFVGYMEGASSISGGSASGNITCLEGACAGFVSSMFDAATIINSTASGAVTCTADNCAGFVSLMQGNSLLNANSTSSPISNSNGAYNGGFASRISGSALIDNSSAAGDVITDNNYSGGFVANASGQFLIRNSEALGAVKGSEFIGGFVGMLWGEGSSILNSFASGSLVNGGNYVGGFIGYLFNQAGSGTLNLNKVYSKVTSLQGSETSGGLIGYLYSGSDSTLNIIDSFVDIIDAHLPRISGGLIGTIFPGSSGGSSPNLVSIIRSFVSDVSFSSIEGGQISKKFGGMIGVITGGNNDAFSLTMVDSYSRGVLAENENIAIAGGLIAHSDTAGMVNINKAYSAIPLISSSNTSAVLGGKIGAAFYEFNAGNGPGEAGNVVITNDFVATGIGATSSADYAVGVYSEEIQAAGYYTDWLNCTGSPCNGSNSGGTSSDQTDFIDKSKQPLSGWDFSATWEERSDNYPRLRCPSGSSSNFCTAHQVAQDIPANFGVGSETCSEFTAWAQDSDGDLNSTGDNLNITVSKSAYYRISVTKTPLSGTCTSSSGGTTNTQGPISKYCGSKNGTLVDNGESFNLAFVDEENFNCDYAGTAGSTAFTLPTGYDTPCQWDPNGTTYTVEKKECLAAQCNEFTSWASIANGPAADFSINGAQDTYYRIKLKKKIENGTCYTLDDGVMIKQGDVSKYCGTSYGYKVGAAENYSLTVLDPENYNCSYNGVDQSAQFTLPTGYEVGCAWDTGVNNTTYTIESRSCADTGCLNFSPWVEVANQSINNQLFDVTSDAFYSVRVKVIPSGAACEKNVDGVLVKAGSSTKNCGHKNGYEIPTGEQLQLDHQGFPEEFEFYCYLPNSSGTSNKVEFPFPTDEFPGCTYDLDTATWKVLRRTCLD